MSLNINLDIAKRLDITCRKGDTFSLEFVIRDADGSPLNLKSPENYTFRMQVRTSDDGDLVISTEENGFSIVGNENGSVSVLASSSVMDSVPSGIFVYDFEATNVSSSNVQTWFFGVFKINDDVTV